MRKRRFVIRTIKSGRVKIYGRIFKPSSRWLEYDGRLDGQRWTFGLYWKLSGQNDQGLTWEMLPYVALWGSKEAYWAAIDNERWSTYRESPISPAAVHGEDGVWYYPWVIWYAVSENVNENQQPGPHPGTIDTHRRQQ